MSWIFPVTMALYSLSILGYFIDFLQYNRKVNKVAFWLLSIVWVLQTIFFVWRTFELERIPLFTPFEGLFFYAWLVLTLSLVINYFFRVDFLVFFTNLVGFSMLSFSFVSTNDQIPEPLTTMFVSELLITHIAVILISYVAFTLSFASQVMYAIQYKLLKQKIWGKRLHRFSSLSKLDSLSYIFVLIAWPLFLIGLILGFTWDSTQTTSIPLMDMKVISSILVLIVYAVFLYRRVVKSATGYNVHLIGMLGFLLIAINYLVSGRYSTFHVW